MNFLGGRGEDSRNPILAAQADEMIARKELSGEHWAFEVELVFADEEVVGAIRQTLGSFGVVRGIRND